MDTIIKNAVMLFGVLTLCTGAAYPLAVTVVSQQLFPVQANGSLFEKNGQVAGSMELAQDFTSDRYFHCRPSTAGDGGYDAANSAASNLGPTSRQLIDRVAQDTVRYRVYNGLSADAVVPADAVTTSGSGLDPDISLNNAQLQANRVAAARGMSREMVLAALDECSEHPVLGILGEDKVNVLRLNLALDRQ